MQSRRGQRRRRRWSAPRWRSRCRSSARTTWRGWSTSSTPTRPRRRSQALPARARAVGRCPSSLSHLQDPSPGIRAGVAEVLGALGGPAAASRLLEPLTKDRDRAGGRGRRPAHRAQQLQDAAPADDTHGSPAARLLRATDAGRRPRSDRQGARPRHAAPASPPASSSKSRPTSANPIPRATPRPGRPRRNAPLYGPPGIAYVYLNYGIHYLVNAVTEPEGSPAAVLIRALEPLEGEALMRRRRARGTGRPAARFRAAELCRGPGNLTRALGITLRHNRCDLTDGPLRIEDRGLPRARGGVDAGASGSRSAWRRSGGARPSGQRGGVGPADASSRAARADAA